MFNLSCLMSDITCGVRIRHHLLSGLRHRHLRRNHHQSGHLHQRSLNCRKNGCHQTNRCYCCLASSSLTCCFHDGYSCHRKIHDLLSCGHLCRICYVLYQTSDVGNYSVEYCVRSRHHNRRGKTCNNRSKDRDRDSPSHNTRDHTSQRTNRHTNHTKKNSTRDRTRRDSSHRCDNTRENASPNSRNGPAHSLPRKRRCQTDGNRRSGSSSSST